MKTGLIPGDFAWNFTQSKYGPKVRRPGLVSLMESFIKLDADSRAKWEGGDADARLKFDIGKRVSIECVQEIVEHVLVDNLRKSLAARDGGFFRDLADAIERVNTDPDDRLRTYLLDLHFPLDKVNRERDLKSKPPLQRRKFTALQLIKRIKTDTGEVVYREKIYRVCGRLGIAITGTTPGPKRRNNS